MIFKTTFANTLTKIWLYCLLSDVLPDSEQEHEDDGDPDESGEEEEQQNGGPGQHKGLNSAQK